MADPVRTSYLPDPAARRLATAEARIAEFTPPDLGGKVTGYVVVGGTSGGFASGEPEFFLNLQRFPSAVLATTIMEHELFHAVHGWQWRRTTRRMPWPPALTASPVAKRSATYRSLEMEGTSALVGDVLALAKTGTRAESQGAHDLRRLSIWRSCTSHNWNLPCTNCLA